jgi:predicted RNase H-like nuclease
MQHNKKTTAGRQERLYALTRDPSISLRASPQALHNALRAFARTQVAFDDLLDAYVLTWSACRIANGQAGCLPQQPPLDQCGLRMEIWY